MIKILYVEDDKLFINIVRMMLTNLFTVDISYDGIDAVAKILNGSDYSLILMDIIIPKMNGFLVAKNIKYFDHNIPIVAITSRHIEDIKKDPNFKYFNSIIHKDNISKESLKCIIYEALLKNK